MSPVSSAIGDRRGYDPNGDGNPSDAAIVGCVFLAGTTSAVQDDTVIGNNGMGGQGVMPIPIVYNGWVQQWVRTATLTTVTPGRPADYDAEKSRSVRNHEIMAKGTVHELEYPGTLA